MSNFLKYMRLFALGITFSSSMALPYVQIKFYDVFREATQASNNELGLLMTIFTAVSMALYIPGGADRGSPKKLLLLSLIMMCGLNAYFAFHTSYGAAQLIWALLAIAANTVQWPTLIKAIRDTGSSEEQGRMFGTFYGTTGIFSSIIGFVGAWIYSNGSSNIEGFHLMLLGQSAFCAVAAVAVGFFVEDKTPYNNNVPAPKENPFKSALTVMKLPAVWMMVVLIFCGYGMYIGITYMTPYTTNVLGASIAFGAVLGTIRAFGLRVLTGPFSGYISDKMGSAAKILAICFLIIIGMLFVILSLPKGTSNAVIILLTMMFSFFGLVIYTTMFACMEEVSIPPQYTGIAVSVISLLGYLPDGLFPPLFGHWLDVYGNQGYSVIFYFLAGISLLGCCVAIVIYRKGRALRSGQVEVEAGNEAQVTA